MSWVAALASPLFFRYWVGYGAILYGSLALALSARAGVSWLAITLALYAAWWLETSSGYCRRCTHFSCGPHGALMRRFFARDFSPLPRWRGLLHACGDLFLFVWPQRWFWSWPWLGVATILWLAIAIIAVLPFSDQARRDAAKFGGLPPAPGVR